MRSQDSSQGAKASKDVLGAWQTTHGRVVRLALTLGRAFGQPVSLQQGAPQWSGQAPGAGK